MPAALFPVLKTFCKKLISIKITLTLLRFNSYKNGSPVQLLQQANPHINRNVLNFTPVLVDSFFHLYKNEFKLLAS